MGLLDALFFWRRKPKQAENNELSIDALRLLNPPVRQKHTHIVDDLKFERTGHIEYVHRAITTD